jgi:hypothetical protein
MEQTFRETRLMPIVKSYEERIGFSFKPNKNTYEKLGINRKRLGMLLSGDAKTPLKVVEVTTLSKFFGVSTDEILQSN